MKNAFLSFLESFASSRSAAVLDRNRDAFSVKVAQNLQATSPYVAPKRRFVGARGASREFPRRSGSLSFVSTRSKVKFLLFFRIVGNFTNFLEKPQEQRTAPRKKRRPDARRADALKTYLLGNISSPNAPFIPVAKFFIAFANYRNFAV